MQNDLLAILHWILRFLRLGIARTGRLLILPPGPLDSCYAGFPGASADFDSARLDAVSRSLLWGAGVLSPERVATANCPSESTAGALALRGMASNGAAWNDAALMGIGRRRRRIDP
jgi:hypothetical protein